MPIQYTYWRDPKDGMWCGYLDSYPNYPTQGRTLDELKYMLGDILDAIREGDLVDTAAAHQYGTLIRT